MTWNDDFSSSQRAAVLFGAACGDSLGATTEFCSRAQAERKIPMVGANIIGGGAFRWKAGAPTDDTDLMLHTAHALLTKRPVQNARDRYRRWLDKGPKDVGGTTRTGLRYGPVKDESAQANGSLMRTQAVGLVDKNRVDTALLAGDISAITHASPTCVQVCAYYSLLVRSLSYGDDLKFAMADAADTVRSLLGPWKAVNFTAISKQANDWPRNNPGWAVGSLVNALWAVKSGLTYEDAITRLARLGGDSDTVCAIAGGLLGAQQGLSAIPVRWIDKLQTKSEILTLVQ